jgi:quercetin dioxygenase-like cupin family protein
VEAWNLNEVDAPRGTRDPVVLHSGDESRAVMIRLAPGQALGEHPVRERAWLGVVEGEVEVVDEGGDVATWPAGTLGTFAPEEGHSVSAPGGAWILLLLVPCPGDGHYDPGEQQTAR